MLAAKPDELSLSSMSHMVGENQLLQVFLWPLQMYHDMHLGPQQINKYKNLKIDKVKYERYKTIVIEDPPMGKIWTES